MKGLLAILAFVVPVAVSAVSFPDAPIAYLLCIPFFFVSILVIKKYDYDANFLILAFTAGFLIRTVLVAIISFFDLQTLLGEDALAHEYHGHLLYLFLTGQAEYSVELSSWSRPWGMHYLIAYTYILIGRNPMAIGFVISLFGSATAVCVYLITHQIFKNRNASRIACLLAAFFPAMLIWSSQILKDGLVVFFVVLLIYSLVRLQENFSWLYITLTLLSLGAIFSIRFYIFYFAAFATVCSFAFGNRQVISANLRWLAIVGVLFIVAGYTGILTIGREQVESMGNLDRIQYSRSVLSRDAASGYGADTDIRTVSGMVSALPIGLANLVLAPFPWQFSSIRSLLTLPEMLLWWTLIPALFIGFRYTLVQRFRAAIPITIFTLALTIAYALFQTNVGTAYRQRTQVQVFGFIYIAVGLTILKERRDDSKKRIIRDR